MIVLSEQQQHSLLSLLLKATETMKIGLDTDRAQKLISYLAMLYKWNKAYNLTAIRDPKDMLYRHIVDSLSILPFISGQRLIDVGTGGGLPGIVLAIMCPDREFVLLDSNGKKTRFLFQVKAELNLINVEIVNKRVEQYLPELEFDGIISRAFSSLAQMQHWTHHLLHNSGKYFAMKGVYNQQEIDELPAGLTTQSHTLFVPGEEGERHLVVISTQQQ